MTKSNEFLDFIEIWKFHYFHKTIFLIAASRTKVQLRRERLENVFDCSDCDNEDNEVRMRC